MQIKLKKLRSLGKWDKRAEVWRQTDQKRLDVDPTKLYLVKYNGIWLLGSFEMQWYGWNFHPNLGIMNMQIEWLEVIYEVKGLSRKKRKTASLIAECLEEEDA